MAVPTLKNLKGIGPHTLGVLKKHGITSLNKLAKAPLDTLVAIQGFGNTRAQMIKDAAKSLLNQPTANEPEMKPEPAHISAVVVQEESDPAAKLKKRAEKSKKKDKKKTKQDKPAKKKDKKKAQQDKPKKKKGKDKKQKEKKADKKTKTKSGSKAKSDKKKKKAKKKKG